VKTLSEKPIFLRGRREGVLSAVSAGFFLILAGTIFIVTPNILDKFTSFFQDFNTLEVPHTAIVLLAPVHPERHAAVYSAVQQFSLVWGIFLVAMLTLRVLFHSPTRKKVENAGDIVFWLGTSYLISTMLNGTTTTTAWFIFWTEILMLAGVSLIVRAAILAAMRLRT
jgi:hypothetical protein